MKLIAEKLKDAPLDKVNCELFDFIVKEFESMLWFKNKEEVMLQIAMQLANNFVITVDKKNKPVKKLVEKYCENIPLNVGDLIEFDKTIFVIKDIDNGNRHVHVSLPYSNEYYCTFDLADYDLVDVEETK